MMLLRCFVALVVMVMQCLCGDHIMEDCYDTKHPRTYCGVKAVTETGIPCQMWASQSPHRHTLGDEAGDFTDGELPSNYCRSPLDGEDGDKPWCYTANKRVRWEYCDVPQCMCTGDFVVYGSSCYAYVNTTAKWQDAQAMTAGVTAPGAWLGGTYDDLQGRWAWATTGEPMDYTNWMDVPWPAHATCLQRLMRAGTDWHNTWSASVCTEELGSVCQKTPNELPHGRVNALAIAVHMLQITTVTLTNNVKDLTQKQIDLDLALQEARHIESGTFTCGTSDGWMPNPELTYEQTFVNAYLAPPTVHVSLATLDTNVNHRQLDVTFAVNVTSTTGFKVVCEHHLGRHNNQLWTLELTWISVPSVVSDDG